MPALSPMRVKFFFAGILLLFAVGYLSYAGMQRGWVYTMGVDQFVANVEQQKLRVRLCGTVSDQALDVQKAQLVARFVMKGKQQAIPVTYKGVIPDMFKAGCEVVVEGQVGGDGRFEADMLMTKCASKYEGAGKTGGQP